MPPVHIGPVTIGGGAPLALIAGPCVIEAEELTLQIARRLAALRDELGLGVIFKASFDKANRTSAKGFRGPGPKKGLEILAKVRRVTGLPLLTDIHLPQQARVAAVVVDVLQIPAFLCRQTDLLLAAARTRKPVNVKKGQFLTPEAVDAVMEKLKKGGCRKSWVTERGTTFGQGDLWWTCGAL